MNISLKYKVENLYYNIKYRLQRFNKGYSDKDLFSIDYYYITTMSKMLKEFVKNLHSYPPEMTFEEWKSIIIRMYTLLDQINYFQNEWSPIPSDCKELDNHIKKISKENFSIHMSNYRKIYDKYDIIKYEDGSERRLSEAVRNEIEVMKKEYFELFVKYFDHLWD